MSRSGGRGLVNQPNFKKVIGEVKQAEAVLPLSLAKIPEPPKEMNPKAEPRKVEEVAPKPKAKNPLDFLQPSHSDREHAIEGFWDKFDPKVYSLWFCKHKPDVKDTQTKEIMKKIGEFLPRMDPSRIYGFGKMSIIGNMGLWLFFGPKIPHFFLDECYDMQLYEWNKVDPSDEDQKKRVSEMLFVVEDS